MNLCFGSGINISEGTRDETTALRGQNTKFLETPPYGHYRPSTTPRYHLTILSKTTKQTNKLMQSYLPGHPPPSSFYPNLTPIIQYNDNTSLIVHVPKGTFVLYRDEDTWKFGRFAGYCRHCGVAEIEDFGSTIWVWGSTIYTPASDFDLRRVVGYYEWALTTNHSCWAAGS